jgi:hypothetical protein
MSLFTGGLAKRMRTMGQGEHEATIVAFMRTKGVPLCLTACVSRTQGAVGETDRASLENYGAACEWSSQQRIAARRRLFWTSGSRTPATE